MKVKWTQAAAAHLDAIYAFIAQNSPVYAQRMVDRITRRSKQIGRSPRSGSMVEEYFRDDLRQLIEGPFRIIYRIREEQVDVIAVIHGAMDLPPLDS